MGTNRLRYAAIFALPVFAVVAWAGCGSGAPGGRSPQDAVALGHDNFRTAVSKSVRREFTIYWLGTEVQVGSAVLVGPAFAVFDGQNDQDGFDMEYLQRGGGIGLNISLFSASAWATAEPHVPANQPGSNQSSVMAGNYAATLYRTPLRGRPNLLEVAIPIGDTVVLASTSVDGSHPNATPPTNPLTDEATLLSVLGELRPYPQ